MVVRRHIPSAQCSLVVDVCGEINKVPQSASLNMYSDLSSSVPFAALMCPVGFLGIPLCALLITYCILYITFSTLVTVSEVLTMHASYVSQSTQSEVIVQASRVCPLDQMSWKEHCLSKKPAVLCEPLLLWWSPC